MQKRLYLRSIWGPLLMRWATTARLPGVFQCIKDVYFGGNMNAALAWGNGPKPRLSDNATDQLVPKVKPPFPYLHKNHPMNTFLIPRAATLSLVLLACTPTWAQNTVTAAAAQEPGAQLTASGMVYRSLKDGTGAMRAYEHVRYGLGAGNEAVREDVRRQLLRYCQLDTAAMVMIWKHWLGQS